MGQKLINEIGNKYGTLTVIEQTKDKNNRTAWLCKCDCGNTKIVRGSDLRKGKITTCGKGCKYKSSVAFIDEIGNRYGTLTVLSRVGKSSSGKVTWLCQCDCGNQCIVVGSDLRSGQQQSCGCLKSKGELQIRKILLENNINFKTEYGFSDLLSDKHAKLRFDFAIFNNSNLVGLIEFQGEQHFYPVEQFGGIEEYNNRYKRDQLKIEYCNKNNIPLLFLRKNNDIYKEIKEFLINIGVWD